MINSLAKSIDWSPSHSSVSARAARSGNDTSATAKAEFSHHSTLSIHGLYMSLPLDTKYALYRFPWQVILGAIIRKAIPFYLVRVNYPKDRTVTSERIVLLMMAGVP